MTHSSKWLTDERKVKRFMFLAGLPSFFFLSHAALTFEVAPTRIFFVMLDHHYVVAILSAALLGLGLRWQSPISAMVPGPCSP